MITRNVSFVIPSSAAAAYQGLANKYAAIEPPTWALLLAQALRVEGHEPCILDFDADPKSNEIASEIFSTEYMVAIGAKSS